MWTGSGPPGILSWDGLLWKRTNLYCHYCSFNFIFLCSSFDSFSLPPLYSHPSGGKQDILWNSFLPVWVHMTSLISNSLQWKWRNKKHNCPAEEPAIKLFFVFFFFFEPAALPIYLAKVFLRATFLPSESRAIPCELCVKAAQNGRCQHPSEP